MATVTKFDRMSITLLILLAGVIIVLVQPAMAAMVLGKIIDVIIFVAGALGKGASAVNG